MNKPTTAAAATTAATTAGRATIPEIEIPKSMTSGQLFELIKVRNGMIQHGQLDLFPESLPLAEVDAHIGRALANYVALGRARIAVSRGVEVKSDAVTPSCAQSGGSRLAPALAKPITPA